MKVGDKVKILVNGCDCWSVSMMPLSAQKWEDYAYEPSYILTDKEKETIDHFIGPIPYLLDKYCEPRKFNIDLKDREGSIQEIDQFGYYVKLTEYDRPIKLSGKEIQPIIGDNK